MKKIISVILAAALVFALAVTAMAAEMAACTVSADSVQSAAGKTVTVPIRISGNRGFTNFGIALDYDREKLELVSIQTAGEAPYLCGAAAAANPQWTDPEKGTYGYVTAALEKAATEDGVLFAATFRLSEDFSGTATVRPVVRYMRGNLRLPSVFDEIPVTVENGTVSTVLVGDYDQNGIVTVLDVMGLYSAVIDDADFSEADLARLDVNQDGVVNMLDVMAIYAIVADG